MQLPRRSLKVVLLPHRYRHPHADKTSDERSLRKPDSQAAGLGPRNPSSFRKPAPAAEEFRFPSPPAPHAGRPSPRLRPCPLGSAPSPRARADPPQTCACAEQCDQAGLATSARGSSASFSFSLLIASSVVPLLSFPQPTSPSRFSIRGVGWGRAGGVRPARRPPLARPRAWEGRAGLSVHEPAYLLSPFFMEHGGKLTVRCCANSAVTEFGSISVIQKETPSPFSSCFPFSPPSQPLATTSQLSGSMGLLRTFLENGIIGVIFVSGFFHLVSCFLGTTSL